MYSLILQRHRESLMKLLEIWHTPLASSIRYQSQARTAVSVASSLAGTPTPLELQWLPPVVCNVTVDGLSEEVSALPPADLDVAESLLDPDQIALTDVLEDMEADPHTNEDSAGDTEDQNSTHSVNLIWDLPFVSSFVSIHSYLVILSSGPHK